MSRKVIVEFIGQDTSLGRTTAEVEGKTSKLSGQLVKFGKVAAAGLAAGGVAAGAALYKIGSTFDDAYDTIRVGTGATGDALEGLKDDFKQVAQSVPASMEDVSTSIADLNTRLGLTGKPLQDLSAQMLNMSRITGTDLSGNIETITRTFGDWDIKTKDMSGAMDKLFRASQATGPSVDKIAAAMTKFGSPLRQLGFGFEETAALIGKFEKEGVNTGLVLGSMRQALGKMAREGEPAQETLARVTEEIKNAGSVSEANKKALELFGARAGPDMAAAIREGRFELGDLFKTVKNGTETITKASDDTADFAEKWQIFKNRALVALEPLAIKVFDAIGNGMDQLLDAWDSLEPEISKLGPIFTQVQQVVSQVMGNLQGDVGGRIEGIKQIFTDAVSIIQSLWALFGDNLLSYLSSTLANVMTVLSGAFDVIRGIFQTVSALLKGDWAGVWEGIKTILSGATQIVIGIVKQLWNMITTAFKNAGVAVKAVFGLMWDGIKALARTSATWLVDQIQQLPSRISSVGGKMLEAGKTLIGKLWEGIKNAAGNAGGFIADLVGKLKNGINSMLKLPLTVSLPKVLGGKSITVIPQLARGVSSFPGGLAELGEHGRELAALPGGTRVYPAHRTEAMYASARRGAAAGSTPTVNLTVNGFVGGEAELVQRIEQMMIRAVRDTGRPMQFQTVGG